MVDENEESAVSRDSRPEPEAKSSSGSLPIAAGGLVFVIFVIIFSLKFGVFSSSNVSAPPQPVAVSEQHSEDDSDAVEEEDQYDDAYLNYFPDYDDEEVIDDSGLSPEDSVAQVAWYVQQKNEIKQERAELEREKARLQQLRDQTEAILQRRAALEDASIATMAKLYESMKTEELVPILANLPDSKVSLIIAKMKKQKASSVLGQLEPARAAKITNWLITLEDED
jgi:flagellar motility protein MotE (MotC chaperone)